MSLMQLLLEYTALSREDLYSLSAVLCDGKLPNLDDSNLSNNILTDFLEDLLSGTVFTKLRYLGFRKTKLSRNEIKSIASVVQSGKCPPLEHLNLSRNRHTDCLQNLLDMDYPALNKLSISNASPSANDINILCKAAREGRLPKLTSLDLSQNVLTNYVCELLCVDFPSLEYLEVDNTELCKVDIKSLSAAVREGRLQNIESVNLSGNILMDCMKHLLEHDHGLPQLEFLFINNTQLSRDDLV